MVQKTEASQAVDLPFPPMPLPIVKHAMLGGLFDHFAMQQYAMRYADLVVAALKAQLAPTEARTGELEIPEPGDSDSLADRIFRLPCKWKGDPGLSAAIEMGHAMACEQAYDLAYEHAAQSAQPSGNTGELAQGEDSARLELKRIPSMNPACRCEACNPQMIGRMMFICGLCGDKRCPHVANHANPCQGRARASAETGGVKS